MRWTRSRPVRGHPREASAAAAGDGELMRAWRLPLREVQRADDGVDFGFDAVGDGVSGERFVATRTPEVEGEIVSEFLDGV